MGKQILSWLLLISCPPALFLVGVLAAFLINISIYGDEEFNHNAGAGFAVLLEGIALGIFLGSCGIVLAIFLKKRIPWLRARA
jgi:hypothetical protein